MQRVEEFGSIGLSYLSGEGERESKWPTGETSIQRDDDKQTIQTLVITAGRQKKAGDKIWAMIFFFALGGQK